MNRLGAVKICALDCNDDDGPRGLSIDGKTGRQRGVGGDCRAAFSVAGIAYPSSWSTNHVVEPPRSNGATFWRPQCGSTGHGPSDLRIVPSERGHAKQNVTTVSTVARK